mgnify:CR=1 FL=1
MCPQKMDSKRVYSIIKYLVTHKLQIMKKIIVFGATGNLGAYIALHMKSQGYGEIFTTTLPRKKVMPSIE